MRLGKIEKNVENGLKVFVHVKNARCNVTNRKYV